MRHRLLGATMLTLLASGASVTAGSAAPEALPAGSVERPSIMQAQDRQHLAGGYSFAPAGPAQPHVAAPRTRVYNGGGLNREVFGFAPYWELASGGLSDIQYDKVSTLAYFGLTINSAGAFDNDAGMSGWNSSAFASLLGNAHGAGDRVVLVVKQFDEASINAIVSNPATGNTAINSIIGAARAKGVDGVNIDFEGTASNSYPNIQADFTSWMGRLRAAMNRGWPGSYLTLDAYSGSASWNGGFMRIDTLAPYVDAFFIMAYDMNSTTTLPNSPLAGPYTYTDTSSIDQFLSKVGGDGSKVILGVPYYGYKYSTTNSSFNAPISGTCDGVNSACSNTYSGILDDFTCAQSLTRNWDTPSSTPWASWYSPASGDPCGGNHNSWREIYYDDARSIGAKYDLVNNRQVRGAGIWALGFDHGHGELWATIASRFQGCPPVNLGSGHNPVVGVEGADAGLWVTRGAGFDCLGGTIAAAPAVASVPQANGSKPPLFIATAPNHDLYVRNSGSPWQPLDSSGVNCVDNPAVVISGAAAAATIHVACQGGDQAIWYAEATVSGSALPRTAPSSWRSLGGTVLNGPAVDMLGGQVTVYANGTDGHVWTRTLASPYWSQTYWQCIGHPAAADAAGVAHFACQGTDRALYYSTNAGAGWSVAGNAGGILVDGPGLAVNGLSVTFYVEGGDQGLWERTLAADGTLSPGWNPDGGKLSHGVGATYN